MDITRKSLTEVDMLFGEGKITRKEAEEYVAMWNAVAHFTVAKVEYNYISNRLND
jgi:hypothetical protein